MRETDGSPTEQHKGPFSKREDPRHLNIFVPPRTPLATPACLRWPFGLVTALLNSETGRPYDKILDV